MLFDIIRIGHPSVVKDDPIATLLGIVIDAFQGSYFYVFDGLAGRNILQGGTFVPKYEDMRFVVVQGQQSSVPKKLHGAGEVSLNSVAIPQCQVYQTEDNNDKAQNLCPSADSGSPPAKLRVCQLSVFSKNSSSHSMKCERLSSWRSMCPRRIVIKKRGTH